jgi:hypothetical protein
MSKSVIVKKNSEICGARIHADENLLNRILP